MSLLSSLRLFNSYQPQFIPPFFEISHASKYQHLYFYCSCAKHSWPLFRSSGTLSSRQWLPEVRGFTNVFFNICLIARYYQCVHGTPQEHTCPAGLLWNQALKACDWHSNAKCSTSTYRTTTTTTTTSTATAATATARTTTSSTTTTTTRPTTNQCQCGVKPAKSNAVHGIVGGNEATVRC